MSRSDKSSCFGTRFESNVCIWTQTTDFGMAWLKQCESGLNAFLGDNDNLLFDQ